MPHRMVFTKGKFNIACGGVAKGSDHNDKPTEKHLEAL